MSNEQLWSQKAAHSRVSLTGVRLTRVATGVVAAEVVAAEMAAVGTALVGVLAGSGLTAADARFGGGSTEKSRNEWILAAIGWRSCAKHRTRQTLHKSQVFIPYGGS